MKKIHYHNVGLRTYCGVRHNDVTVFYVTTGDKKEVTCKRCLDKIKRMEERKAKKV